MAKYSYLWKTTDTGKELFLPLGKGRQFEKRGMLSFVGKFQMALVKGATMLVPVKKK